MILFPTPLVASVFIVGAFLVLGALLVWWDKGHAKRNKPSAAGYPRALGRENAFDWGTAGVFLLTGLTTGFLPQLFPYQWQRIAASLILAGGLQGAWMAFGRKGPGTAWGGLAVLNGLCNALFVWQLPLLLTTAAGDPAINFWRSNYLMMMGLAAVAMKVWLLSRYYRRAWLVVLAWYYSRMFVPVSGLILDTYSRQLGGIGNTGFGFWLSFAISNLPSLLFTCVAMGVVVARPKRPSEDLSSASQSSEFSATLRSLKRCRPLEDPVRTVRNIMGRWGLLITAPIALWASMVVAIAVWADSAGIETKGDDKMAMAAVNLIVPALQMTVIGLIVWFLTPSSETRPNAFFVRAFRRDDQTSRLRDIVNVALGPNGRLLGIRDPRKRFGPITRLFALLEGALRYLGGNQCDLEGADRNWLARVLATLQLRKVDIVLIDLREATKAVTVELKVVTQAMTPLRVIWLIDDTHTVEEWRQRIHLLTEGGVDAEAPLNLLNVRDSSDSKSSAVVEMVERVLAEGAQPQRADEWGQALEQAHQLARSHVEVGDWNTSWFETLSGGFWITAGISTIVMAVLHALDLSGIGLALMVLVLVAGFVLFLRTLISGTKAIVRRRRLARLGKELAPQLGW